MKATNEYLKLGSLLLLAIIMIFALIVGVILLAAKTSVWSASWSGEAELKRAEWNCQVKIKEAQAEIERAKGIAKSNKIIGDSLKDNEQYLRYLWINTLPQTKAKIIYFPTEAGLPILEAGKR
jgi:hypothetical protein